MLYKIGTVGFLCFQLIVRCAQQSEVADRMVTALGEWHNMIDLKVPG